MTGILVWQINYQDLSCPLNSADLSVTTVQTTAASGCRRRPSNPRHNMRTAAPNFGGHGVVLGRRLRHAADLARGLTGLHRAGLCHLDVKPENVLLDARHVALRLDVA